MVSKPATLAENAIDTPWNTVSRLQALKSAGIQTIIRYYNKANSSTLPEKKLSPHEALAISAAGFDIAVVYQDRQRLIGDFGFDNGRASGERAARYALEEIGQPFGSAIYFAADYDAVKANDLKAIEEYFKGVRDAFYALGVGTEYGIGAYGSGHVLSALKKSGGADYFWLAMSKGWKGYKDFLDSGDWHILQNKETKIGGLDLDTNETNPSHASFGAFRIDGPAADTDWIAGGNDYAVIARGGLNLRGGPGTEFPAKELLSESTVVNVLKMYGDWAMVDLEGDGQADGYCFAAYLEAM